MSGPNVKSRDCDDSVAGLRSAAPPPPVRLPGLHAHPREAPKAPPDEIGALVGLNGLNFVDVGFRTGKGFEGVRPDGREVRRPVHRFHPTPQILPRKQL